MKTSFTAHLLDTRVVFQIYAVLALSAGLIVALWGAPNGLHSDLTPDWWASVVLVRIVGAIVMAAGCSAAALSQIEEARARHRALGWFLAGHAIVFAMVLLQSMAMGKPDPKDVALPTLTATVLVLFYCWMQGRRPRPAPNGAQLRSQATVDQLRAQYEEQIREAAGQEERNRLARDLHDSIKQQIFVMQTAAATAQARYDVDPAGARTALGQLRESARDAMTEMEAMLDHLRATPLENVGLVEALKKQCEALALRTGADVRFEPGSIPPSDAFAPGTQRAVFRIAQEALANVGRHARARSVRVVLGANAESLTLEICDDGTGFEPEGAEAGMGLANMRDRAASCGGTLTFTSAPGTGTVVRLSIPCLSSRARLRASHAWQMSLWASLAAVGLAKVIWDVHVLGRRSEFFFLDSTVTIVMAAFFIRALAGYVRAGQSDAQTLGRSEVV